MFYGGMGPVIFVGELTEGDFIALGTGQEFPLEVLGLLGDFKRLGQFFRWKSFSDAVSAD